MPRPFAAVVLALAVAVAATGATVAVVRSSDGDDPLADPRRAVVSALAARPQDVADSARYRVAYSFEGSGTQREIGSWEGAADFERQRFRARAAVVGDDGGPPREFDSFVFAEWEYTRPVGERRWRRRFFDPRSVGAPTPELGVVGLRGERLVGPAYAADLDLRRQIVDAVTSEVVPLGQAEHRGTTVRRYRATVDGARAAGRLPEPVIKEMRSWDEVDRRRDVEVWLDGRGRVRKMSVLYDHGEDLAIRVENEFWDFGRLGRLDLPPDLDDPTAAGGEGVTSFTLQPGVSVDADSPSFGVSVSSPDEPGEPVTLDVDDTPAPGGARRHRIIRMVPPAGRHLEPGEYRLGDVRAVARAEPQTAYIRAPEIEERCGRDGPTSGTLTVSEAVMYEQSFYVRLHLRVTVTCRPPSGAAPVTFEGEARYHALT